MQLRSEYALRIPGIQYLLIIMDLPTYPSILVENGKKAFNLFSDTNLLADPFLHWLTSFQFPKFIRFFFPLVALSFSWAFLNFRYLYGRIWIKIIFFGNAPFYAFFFIYFLV